MEILAAFKCIFGETMPKFSVKFGYYISQDSHKKQHSRPACRLYILFNVPQYRYSNKYWRFRRWNVIYFFLVTHRIMHDGLIYALVDLLVCCHMLAHLEAWWNKIITVPGVALIPSIFKHNKVLLSTNMKKALLTSRWCLNSM